MDKFFNNIINVIKAFFASEKLFKALLLAVILVGIFLRLEVYLFNKPIWQDEAAIAVNVINRSFFGLFYPLDYVQCAPCGFLVLTKFFVNIFGESAYVFRFLPLAAGILSIFAFYYLSKDVLKNKWIILFANYLFCVNFRLIYFSQEFKQYSLEVLITILFIIFLSKLKFPEGFKKQTDDSLSLEKSINSQKLLKYVILGFLFFIAFLFMMPAPFILGAFIIYVFYKNGKNIKESLLIAFLTVLPFVICTIPYYFFYLLPSKKIMLENWSTLWNLGYLSFNFKIIYLFVGDFFRFLFNLNSSPLYVLSAFVLFISGIFTLLEDRRKVNALILIISAIAFFAMIFHFYPIHDRLSLYLLPLVLLIMLKPLDSVFSGNTKTIKPYFKRIFIVLIVIILTISCFRGNGIRNIKRILEPQTYFRTNAKEVIDIVKNNAKSSDKIIIIGADSVFSDSVFQYYTKENNIDKKPLCFVLRKYNYKTYKKILNGLNGLEKNETFWIIAYGHSYNIYESQYERLAYAFIKRWLQQNPDARLLYDSGIIYNNCFVLKIRKN